jgi:putative endonuclease
MDGDDQVTRYTQNLGKWGELIAAKHLAGLGYQIIAANHRTPFGEIDIIAQDGNELVFVEVKTRSSNALGNPEGSVTVKKQQHILESAQHYLISLESQIDEWRVDVVAITGRPGNPKIDIQVFQNALYF